MIIRKFLEWSRTASAGDRARAAGLLARAYLHSRLTEPERRAAEAAMMVVLDDPSPKVRMALAEVLASSADAPRDVIWGLANDQIEVAGRVLAVSTVLTDGDLVDLVGDGRRPVQRTIASRASLSVGVCAAIAEVGCDAAVCDLLDNPDARLAPLSLRRIADRFGDVGEVRLRLLERPDLPCEVRHGLIFQVSRALSNFSFVTATVGAGRLRRVTQEACQNATLQLARSVAYAELPALVEHLRISGKLTPAFLVIGLCAGDVEFFAGAIVSLSGYHENRVRGILNDGRLHAMRALYRAAGLPSEVIDVFIDATLMWRELMAAGGVAGGRSIPQRLIAAYAGRAGSSAVLADLLLLFEKMELAASRESAREYARSLVDHSLVERAA